MHKRHFGFFRSPDSAHGTLSGLIPLSQLPGGITAQVHSLSGGKNHCTRLASLGLTVGAEVQVLQNYGHGPMILSVRGVRLALGRGEAGKIQVQIK